MLQKTNTPNPLNFFNVRRFKKKPKNLICQPLSLGQDAEEPIVNWIDQNLKSRFYFGRHLQLNSLGKFDYVYLVGFESPKEMSIFDLSCPYLHSR